MEEDIEYCKNCRYWNSASHCHRFPPQVFSLADDAGTAWPVTGPNDYCGEFKPAASKHYVKTKTT